MDHAGGITDLVYRRYFSIQPRGFRCVRIVMGCKTELLFADGAIAHSGLFSFCVGLWSSVSLDFDRVGSATLDRGLAGNLHFLWCQLFCLGNHRTS